jgi:DNA-binding PadR family transcriptional regulator
VAVSKVEVVVLGLLDEEPLYGYDLLERFRARSMGFWVEVGRASVYQSLHRLEASGFISGRERDGSTAPDRRVYRITKAGKTRLREGLRERFEDLRPYETEAGTALGFLGSLSAVDTRKAFNARETAVNDLLSAIRDERSRTAGDRARGVANAMLDRQESLARAELSWLRSARSKLKR